MIDVANDIKEKYPYLSQHKDFALVYMRYSEALLHDLEGAVKKYVENGSTEEAYEEQSDYGYADVLNWHNGTITTDELFDVLEEEWHHIADNADAVFYVAINGDISTREEAAAIAKMLTNEIPKDADHIGSVKDFEVKLDGYTFEEKDGYASYAVSCRLGTVPEPPEDDMYFDVFDPIRRLETTIKSTLADKGYKVIYAIDRYCDVTLALTVEGTSDAQDLQIGAWKALKGRNSDCYVEVKQGDTANTFLVDYGYSEVVTIVEGHAGNYDEPPEPDYYNTWDVEDKAVEMSKELKAAIEGLGCTVTECTVRENRIENDERLDDKQTLRGIVEHLGIMEAGKSITRYCFGENDYAITVTKSLDEKSHVVALDVRKGDNIIGHIDNVPYNMFAHAVDKLIQNETNPRLAELLNTSAKDEIIKNSKEHDER